MSDLTERLRHDMSDPHIYAFDCPVCNVRRHDLAHEAADALDDAGAENARLFDYACRMDALAEQRLMALMQAEAKLAAIDAMHGHHEGINGPYCLACADVWPCPTHLVLHPREELT